MEEWIDRNKIKYYFDCCFVSGDSLLGVGIMYPLALRILLRASFLLANTSSVGTVPV